jgi:hypothetical protein
MRLRRLFPLGLLPAFSIACSSARIPSTPKAVTPVPSVDPDVRGEVAFQVIPPPIDNAPEPLDAELTTQLTHPRALRELNKPLYPSEALAAGVSDYIVVVRITIGTGGRVVRIDDSQRAASTEGPFASRFRAAVDQAVQQWEFTPGVLTEEKPGKDLDGDGKIDYTIATRFQPVPVFYHLRFVFRIVDGKGEVLGGM